MKGTWFVKESISHRTLISSILSEHATISTSREVIRNVSKNYNIHNYIIIYTPCKFFTPVLTGGARGVMVIVDTSSNPGRDWLHFT